MSLITLDKACLNYGPDILLDHAAVVIQKGQKWGLIGRNGAGKSSFLKVIAGDVMLDSGVIKRASGLNIGYLPQELPAQDERTTFEVVASGMAELGQILSEYRQKVNDAHTPGVLEQMAELQHKIEAQDGWLFQQKVEAALSRFELDPDQKMKNLSGGWRRRVSLAKTLVNDVDLLILDEPTNHLDILAIKWLEGWLQEYRGAVLMVTHDRALMQRTSTHIAELDRGNLYTWEGDYQAFLVHREAMDAEEARRNALFDKKLSEEEAWLRKGIKARRTRNEGRVRALESMREDRKARREKQGKSDFTIEVASSSGKLVSELEHASFQYDGRSIIDDFSLRVMRGDRIGLLGANGVGKSTLLKLILGKLQPTSGKVRLGTKLEIAYFDQLRDDLDLEKTPAENIAEGREFIEINGQQKHIMGYLADFLFSGQRARTPVKALSGGERNRVMLAKLFSKPANLLVMDEPTNDLDVETLELLEERLAQFDGTLLLVSHDRAFLDNVVSSTIVFSGQAQLEEFVGGCDDWLRQGGSWDKLKPIAAKAATPTKNEVPEPPKSKGAGEVTQKPKKLSYKLQRELDALPAKIEKLELRQEELHAITSEPEFYQQTQTETAPVLTALEQVASELEDCYQRWEALEQ